MSPDKFEIIVLALLLGGLLVALGAVVLLIAMVLAEGDGIRQKG